MQLQCDVKLHILYRKVHSFGKRSSLDVATITHSGGTIHCSGDNMLVNWNDGFLEKSQFFSNRFARE